MDIDPRGTIIDMTPEGGFAPRADPRPGLPSIGLAGLLTIAGGVLVGLALILWVAITVLPVLAALVLAGYLLSRFRGGRWRSRGLMHRASFRRH